MLELRLVIRFSVLGLIGVEIYLSSIPEVYQGEKD